MDEHVLPIAAGDGVVTRFKTAVGNFYMPAAPDMDAIPAFGDMHSLEYGVFQGIAQKSIIRRPRDGHGYCNPPRYRR